MSLVSVWSLLLLSDALIPELNQTENQSCMPRVVKAPEVYEILRSFQEMLLYVYLLCQVTVIRLGIACGGIDLVCICV